jgi:hypothetical protein
MILVAGRELLQFPSRYFKLFEPDAEIPGGAEPGGEQTRFIFPDS